MDTSTVIIMMVIAVVLWVVISLVVVMAMQGRKQAKLKATAPQETADTAVATPEPQAVQTPAAEAAEEEPTLGRYLPLPTGDLSWQQQLEQLPGILGWILVQADGIVLESSDEGAEEMGATLSRMLSSVSEMSEELGVTPLQLMEWEGPQGSVLVAFPEMQELKTYLVLFLDTEAYKNQMRDLLSQLNWESNLKGEPTV